ncbi:LLM class flavin-dependent oxidoreductase [Streptomyces sp. URMC 127]|uniref:LLM class flavin-dependent oxidoreductase n=1 Tax=Streptomyces sp. URMC 127 TaxID=3423402 RepID=UPI003F1B2F92
MSAPIRPLHLAVSIDRPGVRDAGTYVRAARLAERGRLDFVTLGDTLGPPRRGASRLDALAVLARVAPATERIGLVPTVTTTHTEPFRVAGALATLDWVSDGRAGWTAEVSATEAEARHFGRRAPAPADALWQEAAAFADAAARLWDGCGAGGPLLDRDNPHRAGFEGPGGSVRGPSAVPRPPQGRPVTAVDATRLPARAAAARHADVVYLRTGPSPAPGAVRAAREDLHARLRALGRDPGRVVVLASLPVALYAAADAVALAGLAGSWWADGVVDGFHFRPRDPDRDLALLVDGTVPVLQHRGLLRSFYPGGTLREHLCLPRPANRYATARRTA